MEKALSEDPCPPCRELNSNWEGGRRVERLEDQIRLWKKAKTALAEDRARTTEELIRNQGEHSSRGRPTR